jgi:hypothetical protein
MNNLEEENLINSFKKAYIPFPEGVLSKMNPPYADYLLITNFGKSFGIELTETFHNEKSKRASETTNEFTNAVLNILKNKLPFRFSISIDLNPLIGVPKSKFAQIANTVSDICCIEFWDLKDLQHREIFHFEDDLNEIEDNKFKSIILARGYRNLPKGIENITIFRTDAITESWNSRGEGGVVPDFGIEHLNPILIKKEQALLKYKQCDSYWLVIKEGNYFTGYFKNISMPTPIESTYDKVFLYRSTAQKIVELK